jgi:hypothetical protein
LSKYLKKSSGAKSLFKNYLLICRVVSVSTSKRHRESLPVAAGEGGNADFLEQKSAWRTLFPALPDTHFKVWSFNRAVIFKPLLNLSFKF